MERPSAQNGSEHHLPCPHLFDSGNESRQYIMECSQNSRRIAQARHHPGATNRRQLDGPTPEGFPLAYEVMPGNTADKTTLRGFLQKMEELYGQAERVWVMDRGIPTEEVLAERRASDPPVHYLVGTPKGRLSQYEKALLKQPWQAVREGVQVKLLSQEGELYVLAESKDRVSKERAMRRRQ